MTVILGTEMHGSPISLNPYHISTGRCVIGSLFGGIKPKTDIPFLAKKYLNQVINIHINILTYISILIYISVKYKLIIYPDNLRFIVWLYVQLMQELELEGYITHEVSFKDINKAFDLLQQGKSLRCIIWMDGH